MRCQRRYRPFLAMLLAIACLATAGCVQRRVTVRSNPPGAMVYIDDYPIGATPVSTAYTFYGTRKIRLEKPGYEILAVMHEFPPPFYDYPVVDFFTENVVPWEIRDERTVEYQLQPQILEPTQRYLERADELRNATRASSNIAAPSSYAPVPPPEALPQPE